MSTVISDEVIEKIRQENDIVDIVSEYVQLKKQGRNYFGLCPFHNENTPSFSVTKDKQIFHCFGCGKGGNVITFLREVESFTFMETIRFLAERVQMELPDIPDKKESSLSQESASILAAYEWIRKYYHHLLKYAEEGEQAKSYLKERGLSSSAVDDFGLGYAPLNSDVTVDFLKQKGFHTQTLVKAGLISTHDNQHFRDVFRGRVIYPINNHLGKTVAFSGRALTENGPKYYNSPEHELFQKGKLLFNFDLAKKHIRKQQKAVLFEGSMDVIQAYQFGVCNAVATLGTSLTMHQAKLLYRYAEEVILCYDADEAGIEASFKAANLLRDIGCAVRIVHLPDEYDPDQFIQTEGIKAFKERLRISDTYFSFYMRYQRKKYQMQSDSDRINYLEDITKELANITSPIERDFYVKEIADEFNLSTEIIYSDIEKYEKVNNAHRKNNQQHNSNTSRRQQWGMNESRLRPAFEKAERMLLAYMFADSYILEKVRDTIGVHFNIEEHKIILTHLYALYEESDDINVSKLIDKITDANLQKTITEIAMLDVNPYMEEQEINDYIHLIQQENKDVAYLKTLRQKQKQEVNPILAAKIGLEIIQLEKQIRHG